MEECLATSKHPLLTDGNARVEECASYSHTNAVLSNNGTTDHAVRKEKTSNRLVLHRGPPTQLIQGKEGPVRKTTKSYNNQEWLHSRSAREVRILCEYLEVEERLRRQKVLCTFLIFGSSRSRSPEQWKELMSRAEELAKNPATREEGLVEISRLNRIKWMCEYWVKIKELAKKVSQWLLTAEAREAMARILHELPAPVGGSSSYYSPADVAGVAGMDQPCPVAICTGGGPGMMEAGNCGTSEVPGARSMGMSVSLPHEEGLNQYVDEDLAFQFHYFFTRKFWMIYSTLGVIVAPGGLGTLDEIMEILTLKQTRKMKRDIPIVLFGREFWQETINFPKLVETGVADPKDTEQLFFTDDVDEAFEYLKDCLLQAARDGCHRHRELQTNQIWTASQGSSLRRRSFPSISQCIIDWLLTSKAGGV